MRKDELQTVPTSFRYVAALVSAMLVSSLPLPALSQRVELMVVDVHSVAEGYRASKLIGSSIVNDQNEKKPSALPGWRQGSPEWTTELR